MDIVNNNEFKYSCFVLKMVIFNNYIIIYILNYLIKYKLLNILPRIKEESNLFN